jgi:hypothetical protein
VWARIKKGEAARLGEGAKVGRDTCGIKNNKK